LALLLLSSSGSPAGCTGQLHLPSQQGGVDLVDVGMQEDGADAWLAAITRI
jgi:hypothetical protein